MTESSIPTSLASMQITLWCLTFHAFSFTGPGGFKGALAMVVWLGVSLQCAGICCFNGQWMGAFSALVMALSWLIIIWRRGVSEHGHNIISKWWERWWACSNSSDVDIFTSFVQYGTFFEQICYMPWISKDTPFGGLWSLCPAQLSHKSHANQSTNPMPWKSILWTNWAITK
jgi:hypothetical protein